MPVEQQWQIGKWNISRLGGERDIYIYIFHSNTRSTETMKIFLRSDIVKHASPPPRHISNSSLFAGWMEEYILNFPSGSKTARSYEISLKLYLERRVWRNERGRKKKKEKGHAFIPIIRVGFEGERKRSKLDERPGPIITVISIKMSLSVEPVHIGGERIIGRERIRFSKLMVVMPRLNGKWSEPGNECRYAYQDLSLHLPPPRLGLISYEWLDRGFGATYTPLPPFSSLVR